MFVRLAILDVIINVWTLWALCTSWTLKYVIIKWIECKTSGTLKQGFGFLSQRNGISFNAFKTFSVLNANS